MLRHFVMLLTLIASVTVKSNPAYLEIILYEVNQEDGRYMMKRAGITGEFSNFGTAGAAEGDIIQMHPHSLCDDASNGDEIDYGWVGVVKLSYHPMDQCHLAEKARRAVGKGATAVIFDVTDHPDALNQLNENSLNSLNQPIVLVEGIDATELMKIIEREQIARAVIKRGQPNQEPFGNHLTDPALLMVCVVVIIVVISVTFCKMKCRNRHQQNSLRDWTLQHTKMKKYRKQRTCNLSDHTSLRSEKFSDGSSASGMLCAICLETFQDGEDLRVLECLHEFHLDCIDAWLKQKRSCPLCNRSFSSIPRETTRLTQLTGDNLSNLRDPADTSARFTARAGISLSSSGSSERTETSFRPLNNSQLELVKLHSLRHNKSDKRPLFYTRSVPGTPSDSEGDIDSDDEMCAVTCQNCNLHGRHTQNLHNCSINGESTRTSHRKLNSRRSCSCAGSDKLSSKTFPAYNNYASTKDYMARSCPKRIKEHVRLKNDCKCIFTEDSDSADTYCLNTPPKQFACAVHSSNNTSIVAIRGSMAQTDSGPSALSSSTSFMSKHVGYSSDSSGPGVSKEKCIKLARTPTPCVEYSSSDGASNLGWASYTTLEDVLGTIDDESCTLSN